MFDLVVDVGSFKTSICKAGLGVVLEENTLAATSADMKSIVAVGREAKKLLLSSNDFQPLALIEKGVIKHRKLLSEMLISFFQKVIEKKFFKKHSLIFCTSTCLTANEKTQLQNLAYSLNVSKVKLLPAAVLAYVDACYQTSVRTKIILDIGSDSTEISLVYDTKILTGCAIGIGGTACDEAIKSILLDKYNLIISSVQAEQVKREIATLLSNDFITTSVKGYKANSGEEVDVEIKSEDFRAVFEEFFEQILEPLLTFKRALTTDMVNELKKGGVFVCGGMANFTGLERFINARLQLPVVVPLYPESAVMRGAEIALSSAKILDKVLSNNV